MHRLFSSSKMRYLSPTIRITVFMRKSLLLALFCTIAAWLQAQPVLDQSAVGAVGSVYYLGVQDTFPPGFTIGNAGASQNWDFASAWVNGLDTIAFLDPTTTTYGSQFPTSNLAIQQSSLNDGYAYLLSSASGLDLLGLAADVLGSGSPIVIHQNPPSRVAAFPTTYLSSYNGTTVIDVTVDASGFGIPFVDSARYKNIQVRDLLADGYGNLALPAGPFSNVLRVKDITNQTDSIWVHSFFGWTLYQDSVYTDSTFTWWNDSKGYYLAQATYEGGALVRLSYQDPVIVGRAEPTALLYDVYPNPAGERVMIVTDGKVGSVRITDLQGRTVLESPVIGREYELGVGALAPGCYIYQLRDKSGLQRQSGRLLIER